VQGRCKLLRVEGLPSLESDPAIGEGLEHALPDAAAAAATTAASTPVVDLLAVLQSTLALLDSRAMSLTALLLASLVGLWTQLHAFPALVPSILAWSAWIVLVVALLVMARVMLPHRLVRLADSVLGSSSAPCRFGPEEEERVIARTSMAIRGEIEWLRKHLFIAVILGVAALLEVVMAYVVQKT
jgi:hypothetical protein